VCDVTVLADHARIQPRQRADRLENPLDVVPAPGHHTNMLTTDLNHRVIKMGSTPHRHVTPA